MLNQKKYDPFKKIRKSDYWSKNQMQELFKEFQIPRTTKDMLSWIKEIKNYDLLQELSSKWPLKYSELDHPINIDNFTYQKVGSVKDIKLINSLSEKIFLDFKNITALNTQIHEFRDDSSDETSFFNENGFDRETHSAIIDSENYSDAFKIINKFDLDYATAAIQYQPSGSITPRHCDFLDSLWGMVEKEDPSVMKVPYNIIHKTPENYYVVRLMIALNDWVPGQVFGFEDKYWSQYKKGEVVIFDWAHAKHYACNASFSPRAFLKITGYTKNKNHWLFEIINNNIENLHL